MPTIEIEQQFRARVADEIRVVPDGIDRYLVWTPFRFDDGDHLVIVLKPRRDGDGWQLSDEANTLMRLTYDVSDADLRRGTRQQIVADALAVFQVEDRGGELVLDVLDGEFGNALYSFVQALLKISDVSFLTRQRTSTTFKEDFKALVSDLVPRDRRVFDWHDPARDPEAIYAVDCRVDGMATPLIIHALLNDRQTRDATIALHQFEKWGAGFRSMAIFNDQEAINRKVLARFTDVCDRQFSNLGGNREQIRDFVEAAIADG